MRRKKNTPRIESTQLESQVERLQAEIHHLRHYVIPTKDQQVRTLIEENERLHHEKDKVQDRLDYLLGFHREVNRGR